MSSFDDYHTPVCGSKGRGRGLLKVQKSLQFSEPNVQNNTHAIIDSTNSDQSVCEGPSTSREAEHQSVFSSTPFSNTQPQM